VFLSELETAGFPVNDRSGKVPKQMTSRRSLDERNPGPFQRRINSVPPQRVRINGTAARLDRKGNHQGSVNSELEQPLTKADAGTAHIPDSFSSDGQQLLISCQITKRAPQ